MCNYFYLDFYYEETQIQSMICDLNCKIKNFKENKVDHDEPKSEDLNEQKTEFDWESMLAKCKLQIDIINFNWINLSIFNII